MKKSMPVTVRYRESMAKESKKCEKTHACYCAIKGKRGKEKQEMLENACLLLCGTGKAWQRKARNVKKRMLVTVR